MATKARSKSAAKKKPAKKKPVKKKAAAKRKPAAKTRAVAKKTAPRRRPAVKLAEIELEKAPERKASPKTLPSVGAVTETVAASRATGVRSKDITVFLRELIMMLDAGTPILKSLKSLSNRGERKGLRDLVGGIGEYVESGNPLWQAFAREGKHFPPYFVNLIKAAEASGTLTTVLRRLADYREKRERLRMTVQVALIYPSILVLVSFTLLVILAKYVIPAFREIFASMDVEIGGFSSFIMGTASLVASTWWVAVLIVGGAIFFYRTWWVKNPVNRLITDRLILRLPIAGYITQRSVVSDFMRTLGMLLRGGISMMATLDLCKNSVGNLAFVGVIQDMRDSVEAGEGLEPPLRNAEQAGIIPGVAVDMLLTGEESGSLENVAEQISESYEEDVEVAVGALKEALTPAFVVFMGFVIGAIVLAMFLPLISMIENISSGVL